MKYDEGLYVFRITSQGWTETKERKLPMLVFEGHPTHRVRKNPEGEEQFEEVFEDPQYPDRTLRIVIDSGDDNSMAYAMKKLRYAGFEGDSFNNLNLLNADVRATCEHGEKYENWGFALPPLEEREVNTLDSATVRKLDTLFGKRMKEGKPKKQATSATPAVPAPASAPASAPVYDDEVPF